MSQTDLELKALKKHDNTYHGLETFQAPPRVTEVTISTNEITALCPITAQPDWYSCKVRYIPDEKCIESKSFKLFFWQFRNQGHFIEEFSQIVCDAMFEACQPVFMEVIMAMAPRGGITIEAKASRSQH